MLNTKQHMSKCYRSNPTSASDEFVLKLAAQFAQTIPSKIYTFSQIIIRKKGKSHCNTVLHKHTYSNIRITLTANTEIRMSSYMKKSNSKCRMYRRCRWCVMVQCDESSPSRSRQHDHGHMKHGPTSTAHFETST